MSPECFVNASVYCSPFFFIEVKSNSSTPAVVTVSFATGNGRHTVEYVFVTSRKYFAVLNVGKFDAFVLDI